MNLQDISILAQDTSNIGDSYLDGLFRIDTSSIYYRFLYRLVKHLNSSLVVELGVCSGRSTAHLAAGCQISQILALDPNPALNPSDVLERYHNITLIQDRSESNAVLNSFVVESVDVCFFDTIHEYDQITLETKLWYNKIKFGGFLLFDDITMNGGMERFWRELSLPKLSLPHLHHSGFGVAQK